MIIYADEAGINLLPSVHRTYAEIGQTPILKDACKYTHLSVASGITEDGRLIYQIRQDSFNGKGIVLFLEHLAKQVKEKILLIWDGAKIHSSISVKEYLDNQKSNKIWLVKTPAYCPELNADELVWNRIKNVELKNVCCKTVSELKIKTIDAMEKLNEHKDVILSFFKHPKVGFINN